MRDLYSNLDEQLALAPAVQTATVNGLSVDVRKASGVAFVTNTGALAGAASFSVKLQDSPDNATWADVPAKWVQSEAPAPLVASASFRMGYLGKQPYVRQVFTLASGTSLAIGSVAVLRPLSRPMP